MFKRGTLAATFVLSHGYPIAGEGIARFTPVRGKERYSKILTIAGNIPAKRQTHNPQHPHPRSIS